MPEFILRIIAAITALRIKTGEKLNALDLSKANTKLDNVPTLSSAEGTTFRAKVGAVGADVVNGYAYDVQYTSGTHIITVKRRNAADIVIDLPIEALISNVALNANNDLVFTFESGSTVTVPMSTLLVGVVKSVNGKTPNSSGAVSLTIADIPTLQASLDARADIIKIVNFVTTNPTSGMTAGQKYYNTATKKIFTATSATAGTVADPVNDKLYIRLTDNTIWHWTGTDMVQSKGDLTIGTTSTTAGRGDWTKAAYDHSVAMGDPNTTVPDWATELQNQVNF